jgi:hypothetical protein
LATTSNLNQPRDVVVWRRAPRWKGNVLVVYDTTLYILERLFFVLFGVKRIGKVCGQQQ